MNTLDIDRLNTEVIPRDDDFDSQLTVRERFQRNLFNQATTPLLRWRWCRMLSAL